MARQLYEYWFVQFDFPDENGRPYKLSGGKMVWNAKLKRDIPYGWNDSTLGEFCEMYQPQTIGAKELIKDGDYYVYGANGIVGRYNRYNHEYSEIAMACRGNSCGTINRTLPMSWITGNAMVIKPFDSKISNEFVLRMLAHANIEGAISGSGQPQLTRENLSLVQILYPAKTVIYAFSKIIESNVLMWLKTQKGIDELQSIRDELLPLLMNGQVSVMPTEVNCDLSHD